MIIFLEHMVTYQELRDNELEPSKYLENIITNANLEIISYTSNILIGEYQEENISILKDAYGVRARMKLPKRKLGDLGRVKAH